MRNDTAKHGTGGGPHATQVASLGAAQTQAARAGAAQTQAARAGAAQIQAARAGAAQIQRRDLRRSIGIGTAVAAVTALAITGVAGTGGASAAIDPGAPYGSIVLSLPSGALATVTEAPAPGASAAPSAAPTDPNAAPELKIAMSYQRRNRDLLLKLNFDGAVYMPYSDDGRVVTMKYPADRSIGLAETLEWGDGTSYRVASGNRCAKGTEQNVLRPVKDNYELRKKYEKSGEYVLNYVFKACGLTGGQIAGSLKIRVP